MLILCLVFTALNNTKSKENVTLCHMRKFVSVNLLGKNLNLEGYIFQKFFTSKLFWDGLPVFKL